MTTVEPEIWSVVSELGLGEVGTDTEDGEVAEDEPLVTVVELKVLTVTTAGTLLEAVVAVQSCQEPVPDISLTEKGAEIRQIYRNWTAEHCMTDNSHSDLHARSEICVALPVQH